MFCMFLFLFVNSPLMLFGQEIDSSPQKIRKTSGGITDSLPVAVPVLAPEEAEEANQDALAYNQSIIDLKISLKNKSNALPTAVPLLSLKEVLAANRSAQRYYTVETQKRYIRDFFQNNGPIKNRLSVFFSLIPLLFCFDFVNKRKKEKGKKSFFSIQRRYFILSSVSLFAFGIMVFVPWSVYFGNSSQFSFIFQDFMANTLYFLALTILLCSVLLLVIPPFISDYIVSAIAGLGLCIYFQSMFMNIYLGSMDGIEQNWNQHAFWGWINLIIWIAIIIALICMKVFFKSRAALITSLITTFFFLLETIACISMVASSSENVWNRKNKFICDSSKQFEFSQDKNIMFFVFDALGSGLVNPCFEADPNLKESLKDFTWYTDARFVYNATFPALVHEITGAYISPGNNQKEVLQQAWDSPSAESFFSQIHNAGYETRFFIRSFSIGPEELYHSYFSNIVEREILYEIDHKNLCSSLLQISGFSSVPYCLKKKFFYADDSFQDIVKQYVAKNDAKTSLPLQNNTYYQELSSTGITCSDTPPVFSFHYTRGAHAPFNDNERCERLDSPSDDIIQPARGCFFLLSKLIDLLKRNNIYDKTAIIVCSDHGSRSKYSHKCDMTLMIKPFDTRKKEITFVDSRVSSIDIAPTVLQIACGTDVDLKQFKGYPVSNIPPDRKRKVFIDMIHPKIPDFYGTDGKPLSNINCIREHVFEDEQSFDWKKSFIRFIPWNKNAVVDEKILTTYY